MAMYRIAGVLEARGDDDGVAVNISINGTDKIFQKNIKEIHTKEWLEKFQPEDVAYIGFLAAAEYNNNRHLIKSIAGRKGAVTKNVVFLGMFFVCFLIMCNLTASKVASLPFPFLDRNIQFPAALIFFPITYLFSNVLTEVYGYKVARMVIWCSFTCSIIVLAGTWAAVQVPGAEAWLNSAKDVQSSYALLFDTSLRVFIASSLAYFLGEFLNSMVLAKLKILSAGRHLYVRVVGSTAIAVLADSAIFCWVAFYGILSAQAIMAMVLTQVVFKVTYEIAMLPVTYRIVAFLKNKDQMDYFDIATNFNPFSLKTED
ncbi:VUT family protein [Oxalobacteraceae bacterium CAVE-383]|nr:VUT family protein [Oxalobacteraceae bacterium CAVE-383]